MTAPLNAAALEFVTVRHLATLTTLLPDGFPHVVPVGFTFEPRTAAAAEAGAEAGQGEAIGTVRIITNGPSQKVLNVRRDGRASVCQVDGARWITLAGPARILDEPDAVADAVVAMRFDASEVGQNAQEVVAYGTAVTLA